MRIENIEINWEEETEYHAPETAASLRSRMTKGTTLECSDEVVLFPYPSHDRLRALLTYVRIEAGDMVTVQSIGDGRGDNYVVVYVPKHGQFTIPPYLTDYFVAVGGE